MDLEMQRVCDCLQRNKTRATYKAVAEYLHIGSAQNVSERLGHNCPLASWVVSSNKKHKPTGYSEGECHPDLYSNEKVITNRPDLDFLMRQDFKRQQQED